MAKFEFISAKPEATKSFYVAWQGMRMFSASPLQVFEGDELVGEFTNMDEFKSGKNFNLSSGGTIRVYYKKVFLFIYAIKVELNGEEVKGSQIEQ